MTPKEKAKELYDKMLQWQDTADIYIERNITSNSAKHSALIAVDEIILTTFKKESWDKWNIIPQIESTTEYWQEVKQEIKIIEI